MGAAGQRPSSLVSSSICLSGAVVGGTPCGGAYLATAALDDGQALYSLSTEEKVFEGFDVFVEVFGYQY